MIGSFLSWDFQKPAPFVLDQELSYLKGPHFYAVEMVWRGHKEDSVFPSFLCINATGGRLILKHWKLLNEESQSTVPRDELQTIKYRLMHKAFAWSNNDARLDRFFFQINEPVRKVLLELGWPLHKAEATKKVQVTTSVRQVVGNEL